jgi:multimeric flavodoxin WrbA
MSEAMKRGALAASKEMESPLNLLRLRAANVTIEDVLHSDGYLFCAPENLASVSGEMLEFFHRTYYHAFDDDETSLLTGRPYGLAIAAGSDGTNAARQIERICKGWRLRPVEETYINKNGLLQDKKSILLPKVIQPAAVEKCEHLGGLVAATLLL